MNGSISMTFLQRTRLERQKADVWLSGAGKRDCLQMGMLELWGVKANVFKLNWSIICKSVPIY